MNKQPERLHPLILNEKIKLSKSSYWMNLLTVHFDDLMNEELYNVLLDIHYCNEETRKVDTRGIGEPLIELIANIENKRCLLISEIERIYPLINGALAYDELKKDLIVLSQVNGIVRMTRSLK